MATYNADGSPTGTQLVRLSEQDQTAWQHSIAQLTKERLDKMHNEHVRSMRNLKTRLGAQFENLTNILGKATATVTAA